MSWVGACSKWVAVLWDRWVQMYEPLGVCACVGVGVGVGVGVDVDVDVGVGVGV